MFLDASDKPSGHGGYLPPRLVKPRPRLWTAVHYRVFPQ